MNGATFPCLRQDEVQVWEQLAPANVFKWPRLSDCGFGVGGTAEAWAGHHFPLGHELPPNDPGHGN